MFSYVYVAVPIAVVACVIVSFFIIRYYAARKEFSAGSIVVATLSLSLLLTCLLIIPVDVFSVSSTTDPFTGQKLANTTIELEAEVVRILYFSLYSLAVIFCFLVAPFMYFYYEEEDDGETCKTRSCSAAKYSAFFFLVFVIFILLGFLLEPRSISGEGEGEGTNNLNWLKQIFESQELLAKSMTFVIGCFAFVGTIAYIVYVAFGMFAAPIGFIRGWAKEQDKDIGVITGEDEETERMALLSEARKKKYEDRMSKHIGALAKYRKQPDQANDEIRRQRKKRGKVDVSYYFCACMAPVRFALGIILLVIGFVVLLTVFLSSLDRILHSNCGLQCGYVLSEVPVGLPGEPFVPSSALNISSTGRSEIINPIDYGLFGLAQFFPADYILFLIIIGYLFFSSLAGILGIGLRIVVIQVYPIAPHGTRPQALLLLSTYLLFIVSVIIIQLYTLAPQYTTFGSQTFSVNGTVVPCSLQAPAGACTPSQISTIILTILGNNDVFAIVFYFMNWALVASSIAMGIFGALRQRDSKGFKALCRDGDDLLDL